MGMTTDGVSYWQAETEGIDLLDTTIGDLLDRRAGELPNNEDSLRENSQYSLSNGVILHASRTY